jgi:hypothetical protein
MARRRRVTKACGDGTTFCPSDNVTSQQMAAFMHRLAVNQVVDAATVQGLEPAELAQPGTQGPAGLEGAQGPEGPQGPTGLGGEPGFPSQPVSGYQSGTVPAGGEEVIPIPAGVVVVIASFTVPTG